MAKLIVENQPARDGANARSPDGRVPDDVEPDVVAATKGPCLVAPGAQYLVVETNRYGPLEIHLCNGCTKPFAYSRQWETWLHLNDTALKARLDEEIDRARKSGVPGWRPEDQHHHGNNPFLGMPPELHSLLGSLGIDPKNVVVSEIDMNTGSVVTHRLAEMVDEPDNEEPPFN